MLPRITGNPMGQSDWLKYMMDGMGARNPTADDLKIAQAIGLRSIDSANDWRQIDNYRTQFQRSQTDPLYRQTARNLGIQDYNSANDYRQVLNRLAGGPVNRPSSSTNTPSGPSGPSQPAVQQPTTSNEVPPPSLPEPRFSPGGMGSDVDSGAANGFRRRKSSARIAGLTTKGTSQFKINGQSARSSGLNIGV